MHSAPTRGYGYTMVDRRFLASGEVSGGGEGTYVLGVITRID